MKTRLLSLALIIVMVGFAGCASGPKYTAIANQIPAIPPGDGRMFFYRDSSYVGSLIKPDVDLDGRKIGKSSPGGFFFIDRPPGSYVVSTSTEEEYKLMIEVQAARTIYVRTKIAWGVWVGRVRPVLEDEQEAMKTLLKSKYIGYDVALGGKPRKDN